MDRRQQLHRIFMDILGSEYVYFQPPESVKMHYPCIKYELSPYDVKRANNKAYRITARYTVTVIDRDPDSSIPKMLLERFEMIESERVYKASNLNHFVFVLYY